MCFLLQEIGYICQVQFVDQDGCRLHSNIEEKRLNFSSDSSSLLGTTDKGQFPFAGTPQILCCRIKFRHYLLYEIIRHTHESMESVSMYSSSDKASCDGAYVRSHTSKGCDPGSQRNLVSFLGDFSGWFSPLLCGFL